MKREFSIKRISGLNFMLLVSILLVFSLPPAHAGRLLHAVRIEPQKIDVFKNETVQISWHQSEEGNLDVFICNLDGIIVRTFYHREDLKSGSYIVAWDGRDTSGRLCPNGIYIPIIKIRSKRWGRELYNPTDSPWGEDRTIKDLNYDFKSRTINYTLAKPMLCKMRVGLKEGGPCYKTIFEWQPHEAGYHEKQWDGKDLNGIVEVWKKDKFQIVLDGFSVPKEAIFLEGSENPSHRFKGIEKRFSLNPPRGEKIMVHALHKREFCHDIPIKVDLIGTRGTIKGSPIIGGTADIKVMTAYKSDLEHIIRERFELYQFMDGNFVYEAPQKTLPVIMKLNTNKFTNGLHIFTINLRTSEDHVGTYSMKVYIKN
ncbi:MAG: hypothetical protein SWH54_17290 [Thermodesulfobacteriota bacterium]|nr:hypothetical protein [Thermodesulfobacteriota bacterium]